MQRTAVNEQGAIAGAVARCRAVNLVDGAACTGAACDGEGRKPWQVLQARDGLFSEQGRVAVLFRHAGGDLGRNADGLTQPRGGCSGAEDSQEFKGILKTHEIDL